MKVKFTNKSRLQKQLGPHEPPYTCDSFLYYSNVKMNLLLNCLCYFFQLNCFLLSSEICKEYGEY